jgi:hypothetical protein
LRVEGFQGLRVRVESVGLRIVGLDLKV